MTMRRRAGLLVAIDGPAGAGKSTVARMLAERIGYVLVDTGALYRCVALAATRAGFKPHEALTPAEEVAIGALARELAADRRIEFSAGPGAADPTSDGSGVRVTLDGHDVSKAIRTPEMSLGASRVSAIPAVREALLAMQRQAGEHGGAVLEGRDIGTVVFPDADLKFFLTASADRRAGRRHSELVQKGSAVSLEETLADVVKRDRADTDRPVAPLRQAEDALLIDSSTLSIDAVVECMVAEVRAREPGS